MCSSASDMVPFMPSSIRSLNNAGMVDAVGVGDQRVGHPGQIQQPVPVGVVAGQPGHLQRQHDSHLAEPDLGGQLGEPGPAGGAGAGDAQVVVDHPHRGARPAQLDRPARPGRTGGRWTPGCGDSWAMVDWRT